MRASWGPDELPENERTSHCDQCGEELRNWRQRYSRLCVDCGNSRCRGCGVIVDGKPHTSNGGLCLVCAPSGRRP